MADYIQIRDDLAYLARHEALEGVAAIIAERRRQLGLGYTAHHDDHDHERGDLTVRAADKATGALTCDRSPSRSLAQAGALCAAEIDREFRRK